MAITVLWSYPLKELDTSRSFKVKICKQEKQGAYDNVYVCYVALVKFCQLFMRKKISK